MSDDQPWDAEPSNEPRKVWTPPDTYAPGPIDGVPADVMECMPPNGMIHSYIWWAQQTTFANPIYHLGAILPVLAWDLAMRGYSVARRGAQPALQSFLIGGPGSGKSSALRLAQAFHEDFLTICGETLIGEPWSRERHTPWLQAEGSVPGLLEALHDLFKPELGTTPALLYHEEVDALLTKKTDDVRQTLMQLFDSLPKVERALRQYRAMKLRTGTAPNIVLRPAIGGVFCATNEAMNRTLDASYFEGGLISRCLWLRGKPDIRKHSSTAPREVLRSWVLDGWVQYAHHHTGVTLGRNAAGEQSLFSIDPKVKDCFADLDAQFFKALEADDDRMQASWGRAIEHGQLIACLYAWSRGQLRVTPEDARAAVKLVDWSIRTTQGLSTTQGATDLGWQLAERALQVIQAGGPQGVPKAALYKELRVDKATLDRALATLEDGDSVRLFKTASQGRGRPTQLYRATVHLNKRSEEEPTNLIHLPTRAQKPKEPSDSH